MARVTLIAALAAAALICFPQLSRGASSSSPPTSTLTDILSRSPFPALATSPADASAHAALRSAVERVSPVSFAAGRNRARAARNAFAAAAVVEEGRSRGAKKKEKKKKKDQSVSSTSFFTESIDKNVLGKYAEDIIDVSPDEYTPQSLPPEPLTATDTAHIAATASSAAAVAAAEFSETSASAAKGAGSLPVKSVRVAVIGGGLMGLATAAYIRELTGASDASPSVNIDIFERAPILGGSQLHSRLLNLPREVGSSYSVTAEAAGLAGMGALAGAAGTSPGAGAGVAVVEMGAPSLVRDVHARPRSPESASEGGSTLLAQLMQRAGVCVDPAAPLPLSAPLAAAVDEAVVSPALAWTERVSAQRHGLKGHVVEGAVSGASVLRRLCYLRGAFAASHAADKVLSRLRGELAAPLGSFANNAEHLAALHSPEGVRGVLVPPLDARVRGAKRRQLAPRPKLGGDDEDKKEDDASSNDVDDPDAPCTLLPPAPAGEDEEADASLLHALLAAVTALEATSIESSPSAGAVGSSTAPLSLLLLRNSATAAFARARAALLPTVCEGQRQTRQQRARARARAAALERAALRRNGSGGFGSSHSGKKAARSKRHDPPAWDTSDTIWRDMSMRLDLSLSRLSSSPGAPLALTATAGSSSMLRELARAALPRQRRRHPHRPPTAGTGSVTKPALETLALIPEASTGKAQGGVRRLGGQGSVGDMCVSTLDLMQFLFVSDERTSKGVGEGSVMRRLQDALGCGWDASDDMDASINKTTPALATQRAKVEMRQEMMLMRPLPRSWREAASLFTLFARSDAADNAALGLSSSGARGEGSEKCGAGETNASIAAKLTALAGAVVFVNTTVTSVSLAYDPLVSPSEAAARGDRPLYQLTTSGGVWVPAHNNTVDPRSSAARNNYDYVVLAAHLPQSGSASLATHTRGDPSVLHIDPRILRSDRGFDYYYQSLLHSLTLPHAGAHTGTGTGAGAGVSVGIVTVEASLGVPSVASLSSLLSTSQQSAAAEAAAVSTCSASLARFAAPITAARSWLARAPRTRAAAVTALSGLGNILHVAALARTSGANQTRDVVDVYSLPLHFQSLPLPFSSTGLEVSLAGAGTISLLDAAEAIIRAAIAGITESSPDMAPSSSSSGGGSVGKKLIHSLTTEVVTLLRDLAASQGPIPTPLSAPDGSKDGIHAASGSGSSRGSGGGKKPLPRRCRTPSLCPISAHLSDQERRRLTLWRLPLAAVRSERMAPSAEPAAVAAAAASTAAGTGAGECVKALEASTPGLRWLLRLPTNSDSRGSTGDADAAVGGIGAGGVLLPLLSTPVSTRWGAGAGFIPPSEAGIVGRGDKIEWYYPALLPTVSPNEKESTFSLGFTREGVTPNKPLISPFSDGKAPMSDVGTFPLTQSHTLVSIPPPVRAHAHNLFYPPSLLATALPPADSRTFTHTVGSRAGVRAIGALPPVPEARLLAAKAVAVIIAEDAGSNGGGGSSGGRGARAMGQWFRRLEAHGSHRGTVMAHIHSVDSTEMNRHGGARKIGGWGARGGSSTAVSVKRGLWDMPVSAFPDLIFGTARASPAVDTGASTPEMQALPSAGPASAGPASAEPASMPKEGEVPGEEEEDEEKNPESENKDTEEPELHGVRTMTSGSDDALAGDALAEGPLAGEHAEDTPVPAPPQPLPFVLVGSSRGRGLHGPALPPAAAAGLARRCAELRGGTEVDSRLCSLEDDTWDHGTLRAFIPEELHKEAQYRQSQRERRRRKKKRGSEPEKSEKEGAATGARVLRASETLGEGEWRPRIRPVRNALHEFDLTMTNESMRRRERRWRRAERTEAP